MERVKTGITEFDKMTGGGIPGGSKVLLVGGPGTGKTIFGLQYLYNGATKFDQKGMYISFEMNIENLKEQAAKFGWDFSEVKDKVKFCRYSLEGQLHADILYEIVKNIKSFKPARLVLDSLTAYVEFTLPKMMKQAEFANAGPAVATRYKVNDIVERLASIPGITPILIDEESKDPKVSGFIADSIISLSSMAIGEMQTRTILIQKMRYTDHVQESVPISIESGKGIVIKPAQ